MSDTLTSQAENLRTLALAAEQDIETARRKLDEASVDFDEATARRDRFLAAADLLSPPVLLIEFVDRLATTFALTPAPVDEDPVADELPVTQVVTVAAAPVTPANDCVARTVTPALKKPKAVKAGRPKGAAPVGGRPPAYDRAEVAAVCRLAIEQGHPQRVAVEDAFKVSPAMAGFLIADARKKGHDIPRTRAERAPKADKPTDTKVDTTPAPKVVPPQVTAPKPVDTGADKLVPLFPPGTPRPAYAPKVGDIVLVCDDCGQPFERNVTRLSLHTHDTHQRPPAQAERLPRTWTAEDDQEWSTELAGRTA